MPELHASLSDAHRTMLVEALRRSAEDSKEWGGACFQRGDTFYCTLPQSSGDGYNIAVKARKDQPSDVLVSTYHVHPRGNNSRVFSQNDVVQAQKHGVPSIIGLAENNTARIFDPSTDKPDSVSPRNRNSPMAGSARGREYMSRAQLLAKALMSEN